MKLLATIMIGMMLALSFTSCNKEDDKKSDNTNNQEQSATVDAFFPTGYNRGDVAAWYAATEMQKNNQVNTLAVYIFNDNQVLVTLHRKKVNDADSRTIEGTGSCQITNGDYTNGTVVVTIPALSLEMTLTIQNGTFTAMGATFTKQNTAVPEAQSVTDNGQGGGGQGGNGDLKADPYFPAAYANKTLAAWYTLTDVNVDRAKVEAVFLFTDNTLVKTESKVYSEADGRDPSKQIDAVGTYELIAGDLFAGTISITAEEMNFTAEITNGIIHAMGDDFIKQDNNDAPTPSK